MGRDFAKNYAFRGGLKFAGKFLGKSAVNKIRVAKMPIDFSSCMVGEMDYLNSHGLKQLHQH